MEFEVDTRFWREYYCCRIARRRIAVWKQEDGSARRIYANHYTAATNSWNANPTLVGGANGNWSEGPQIAIDGSGKATVVAHDEKEIGE